MKLHAPLLAVILLASACGGGSGDDQPGPDATGGGATCTVTATITAMAAAKTVTGVGAASCTASAAVEIETCVQWNPSGTFEDIQCMSATTTAMTAQKENLASCGIVAGRKFRARVNVKVNGVAKGETLSSEIACF